MAQSIGINANELYGVSSNAPGSVWGGISNGLAGLVQAFRQVEQQRGANNDAGMAAFIRALETRGQDVDTQRRRDAGYAAGGLLLERDTTSYIANLAKSDVSTQAEKFAQAKIATGRESAARNFMAQTALIHDMDGVLNSSSHAARMLAVEKVRSSPYFADTSAAFKNSLQAVREQLLEAGKGEKVGATMDLDGGPATYQAIAAKILDPSVDPETRVNATASLIMLSTANSDSITDSELLRFVKPDVLECAKARVTALMSRGVTAATMGFMSDRGMDMLNGAVRTAEGDLALLGYSVGDDGSITPSTDATRKMYDTAVASAAENGGTVSFPEEVTAAARGVMALRNKRRDMVKLWDDVRAIGPAAFRTAFERGYLAPYAALNQSVASKVASGEMAPEKAGDLVQQVPRHIERAASAMELPRDRGQLTDKIMSNWLPPDFDSSKPGSLFRLLSPRGDKKEARDALDKALRSLREEQGQDSVPELLEDIKSPLVVNLVFGRAAAERFVENIPEFRKALLGVEGMSGLDDNEKAKVIRRLGDRIWHRLDEQLGDKAVFSVDPGRSSLRWSKLGGAGSGGFAGVVRSVFADAVADEAGALYGEHDIALNNVLRENGVEIAGDENGAVRYIVARSEERGALTPAEKVVEATEPVLPQEAARVLERANTHRGESTLTMARGNAGSSEEVAEINEGSDAYSYTVTLSKKGVQVTERPVYPVGTPMPSGRFNDDDSPKDGSPYLVFHGIGRDTNDTSKVESANFNEFDLTVVRNRSLLFNSFCGVVSPSTYCPVGPILAASFFTAKPDNKDKVRIYAGDALLPLRVNDVLTDSQIKRGRDFMDAAAAPVAAIHERAYSRIAEGKKAVNRASKIWEPIEYVGLVLDPDNFTGPYDSITGGLKGGFDATIERNVAEVMGNLEGLGRSISGKMVTPEEVAGDSTLLAVQQEEIWVVREAAAEALATALGFGNFYDSAWTYKHDRERIVSPVVERIKSAGLEPLLKTAGFPDDWDARMESLDYEKYAREFARTDGRVEGGFFLSLLRDFGVPGIPAEYNETTKVTPAMLATLVHPVTVDSGAAAKAAREEASSAASVSAFPMPVVNVPPRKKEESGEALNLVRAVNGAGSSTPPLVTGVKPLQ